MGLKMQFNAVQLRKAKLPDAQDAQCRSNAGKEWLAQADDSGVQMPQDFTEMPGHIPFSANVFPTCSPTVPFTRSDLPRSGKKEELLDRVAEAKALGVP